MAVDGRRDEAIAFHVQLLALMEHQHGNIMLKENQLGNDGYRSACSNFDDIRQLPIVRYCEDKSMYYLIGARRLMESRYKSEEITADHILYIEDGLASLCSVRRLTDEAEFHSQQSVVFE